MRTYKILSLSVVILLIAVVFVGVVPAAAQYDTMQYRYNAQHSGDYSPVAGPVPSNGQLKWSYTTGSYVSASPAVANGVVYVGSQDHNLYALGTTPTTLTATASATNVAVNQKFTVSGTLKTTNAPVTPVTGQPVYLEASYNAVTWFRISANKNTSSTGAYLFTGYISQSGTYYLRAHFDGTTTYAASVSTPPITVTVS